MENEKEMNKAFEKIRKDLQHFINLSVEHDEKSWHDWILSVYQKLEIKCWEKKDCLEVNCPAFKNECGRCWLIAGSMCACETQAKYPQIYRSCRECDVYRESVYKNPVREAEEHLIILVHSLRTKQQVLKELATSDFLTGVHNRRYFDLFITAKMEEIKRTRHRLVFILIDINDFKQINDTRGHLYGDYVLKECARILTDVTRKADVVIRFGGDEFLITTQDDGQTEDTTTLLRQRIEEKVYHWNRLNQESEITLSLSYGVAVLDHDGNLADALKEADRLMYHDKKRQKQIGN